MRLAAETRWESLRSPHVFMGLLAAPDAGVRHWGGLLQADLPNLLGQFQKLFHQEDGVDEFDGIIWGIGVARRAGATAKHVINCWGLDELRAFLRRKRDR